MKINERFQYSLARFFSFSSVQRKLCLGLVNDFLRGLIIKVTVLLAEANNNQLSLKGEG